MANIANCVCINQRLLLHSDLIFIEPGVKINGAYYRDVLLIQNLLPAIKELSGHDFFIFQQDSASAHRARETVELLTRETPEFISPLLWPPNSPDLNPVDYRYGECFRSEYTEQEYATLRTSDRLVQEWTKFDRCIIDRAIKQWRPRLRACIRAEGGHFEYQL